MIVIAQVATLILPKGEFERDGRRVLPGTYAELVPEAEAEPEFLDTGLGKALWILPAAALAIPKGLEARADIIFFVFLIGGIIGVLRKTGAIDALIAQAIQSLGGSPTLLIAGMMTLFAIGSSTIGMAEEYMPFIPILVTMALAMKLDAIVALAIVYIGAGVGYGCAALNPFTVIIAQDIAGLPASSGWTVRCVLLVVCLGVGIHHTLRYVKRLTADPTVSLVGDVDYSQGFELPEDTRLTGARKSILVAFLAMILTFVWGVRAAGWYLHELSGLFIGLGVLAALLGRLSPNSAARSFCAGAREMTTTALLIGFASTIEVVLSEGQVIDTIIHSIASALDGSGKGLSAIGMLGVQSACNFLVPSGSGQAYVTMPIMAPLADLTGVSRQTSVLAYQMGDGFMNMIVPTNALLMGMLGLGRIPYQRWAKFVVPLLFKLMIVGCVALISLAGVDWS